MLFCTDIGLTEQALSSLDGDVYKIFIIGIWRIHPTFSTAVWHFQVWMEMFIKYSLLEYGEFILPFQLQFGSYEADPCGMNMV